MKEIPRAIRKRLDSLAILLRNAIFASSHVPKSRNCVIIRKSLSSFLKLKRMLKEWDALLAVGVGVRALDWCF